ncbi:hypothetical protein SAMN06309944_0077 [Micrococcales bacterium KH10]|nr:hypothetical protein SAMN06309944_0077 [Micrococcales bacterium KH10]
MWWWIWVTLVVASLAGYVVLGIWLWRRGANLIKTADDCLAVFDRLDQVDPNIGTRPRPVTALGDIAAAREYREERRRAKYARRDAKYDRHRIRWQQWSTFNE